MSEGVQLVLWIAGVHLIGFLCVAVLMLPALRENPGAGDDAFEDGDDGWGRGPSAPPPPPARPQGGIPLPDATPASVRLRGPGRGRLGEQRPSRERRPVREPARRPVRAPQP